jgi:uncharacterized RDD family membrane protein YckC
MIGKTMTSFKQRSLSWLIDSLISLTPFFILLPFALLLAFSSSANDQLVGRSLLLLGLLPSLFFYFVIAFIQISRGQFTLGQKVMKIKLVKLNQQPTGIINAVLYFGPWLLLLVIVILLNLLPLLFIAYLWSLVNSQQRNLFHFISKTKLVVQTKEDFSPTFNENPKESLFKKLQQLK